MTDPNAYVTGQLAQQAATVQGTTASEADIAQAAQASAGLGITAADLDAIKAQLASFQAQLDAQAAAQAKATPDDITGSVASLNHHLLYYADPVAVSLGQDAAEAAQAVADGGNTGALSSILAKITARLTGRPPYPGENFHYHSAVAAASALGPVIDRVNQAAEKTPAKVVAGSVVG